MAMQTKIGWLTPAAEAVGESTFCVDVSKA